MPIAITELLKPKLSPVQKSIIDVLDSSPLGELLSVPEVLAKARCGRDTLTRICRKGGADLLGDYRVLYNRTLYFGKPATITQFKKQAGLK